MLTYLQGHTGTSENWEISQSRVPKFWKKNNLLGVRYTQNYYKITVYTVQTWQAGRKHVT